MNIDYIKFLEKKASVLEHSSEVRKDSIGKVVNSSEQFLSGLDKSPVYNHSETNSISSAVAVLPR